MKILVVSHTYIVELNRRKWQILAELDPDVEVMIIVPQRWKPGGVQNQVIESEFCIEGFLRVVPVSNFSENNQGLLTFGWDLIPILLDFQPDIIQVEQGSKSLAYTQLILLNKILKLNAVNIFFTWWNLPYKLKFPVSRLEGYNLYNTDAIVAGNQDGAEILRERGYEGEILVAPQLGVDETLFKPIAKSDPNLKKLGRDLGISDQDFIVGYVGRFVAEKGLLTLLESLAKLPDIPWKLLLLGRGDFKSVLQERSRVLGISDRLIFIESVPHNQVFQYINLMDTLVLPSETTKQFKTLTNVGWKEQFGHVLIEAMACQIPVIGSDSGEIPNVIGDSGLIFPEGNVEKLQNCLHNLMVNPSLAKDLGQKGYQRAMAFYTNQALAEQLLQFYNKIMS